MDALCSIKQTNGNLINMFKCLLNQPDYDVYIILAFRKAAYYPSSLIGLIQSLYASSSVISYSMFLKKSIFDSFKAKKIGLNLNKTVRCIAIVSTVVNI